jgi:hypothetical protein
MSRTDCCNPPHIALQTGVEGVEGEALDAQQQDALEAATK